MRRKGIPSGRGWVAGLALGLLLGACSVVTAPMPARVSDVPEAHAAYVVIGYRAPGTLYERQDVKSLTFVTVDPERGLLIDPDRGGFAFTVSIEDMAQLPRQDGQDAVLVMRRIPAGTYFLNDVRWGSYEGESLHRGSLTFRVAAGEVAYVGDVRVELPDTVLGDVRVSTAGYRSDLAKDLLANRPELARRLHAVETHALALACRGPGVWPFGDSKACYVKE